MVPKAAASYVQASVSHIPNPEVPTLVDGYVSFTNLSEIIVITFKALKDLAPIYIAKLFQIVLLGSAICPSVQTETHWSLRGDSPPTPIHTALSVE